MVAVAVAAAFLPAAPAVAAAAPSAPGGEGRGPTTRPGRPQQHPRLDRTLRDDLAAGRANRPGHPHATTPDGRVTIVVEAVSADAAERAVRAVGGTIDTRLTQRVQARVPAARLGEVADADGVVRVREPRFLQPAVTSEGVASIGAGTWQTGGIDGAGVKVAVIDVGFAGYTDRLGTELPSSVETDMGRCSGPGKPGPFANPHGTGVAEIVHDVAPAAALRLVCVLTEEDFVAATATLAANGVTVANASIGSPTGRGDGFGGADTTAGAVAALRRQGILLAVSAGNYGGRHYHQLAVGDTDWPAGHSSEFLDYVDLTSDDSFAFTVRPNGTAQVFLRWDNWPGDTSLDFDMYIDGDQCGPEVAVSDFDQSQAGGPPIEYATVSLPSLSSECAPGVAQTFRVYINRWKGTATPRLDLFFDGDIQAIERSTGSDITEPATAPGAVAVGAMCRHTLALQPFSGTGPLIDGRTKPDLVAPDAVSNSVYGTGSSCSTGFTGTSAASPHVAGAAALIREANPSLQVAEIHQLLVDWAIDMGPVGRDNQTGAGRLRLGDPAAAQPRTAHPFTPLSPVRLFDSRPGVTGAAEQAAGVDRATPVAGGSQVAVRVAGLADVPATATAVLLNVTAAEPTAASYITVHPGGVLPNTSNLNFSAGQTVAQHVTATVGAGQQVYLFNAAGNVHLIVDIAGWYGPDGAGEPGTGRFNALPAPARAFDTRAEAGYAEAGGNRTTPIGPGEDVAVTVAGLGGVPPSATGVIMNVTVTSPTAASYLTTYPAGSSRPTVSSVNWRPGQTVANLVVAPVGQAGAVRVFNETGTVDVVIDVIGWFQSGSGAGYVALDPPTRNLDTRTGTGGRRVPLTTAATFDLEVANLYGVPSDATAAMLSMIAVGPTGQGFLTVFPSGQAQPNSSNLNFTPGSVVPNAVVARVGAAGRVALFNSNGSTHYVSDLSGYFVDRTPPVVS